MAERSGSKNKGSTPGWLASLVGAVFLISAGFMLGLVVGVVKDEPELVMNHIAGESEEVAWSQSELGLEEEFADSAAGLQGRPAYVPIGQGEGWPATDPDLEAPPSQSELVASQYPPIDLRPASEDVASSTTAIASTPAVSSPSPPKAQPPAVSAPPPARRAGFSVQVGAFSESAPAHRVADDLEAKGYKVYITPSASSRDGRWRVRVGPLPSREKAQDVAHQLKVDEQLPTWVLSEGGG
jgi:DedD protein